MKNTVQVLLVQNQPIMHAALRELLDKQDGLEVVNSLATSGDVVALAEREQPDVILVDLMLNDGQVLDGIPDLLTAAPGSHAVVLTDVTDLDLPRKGSRHWGHGAGHENSDSRRPVLRHRQGACW